MEGDWEVVGDVLKVCDSPRECAEEPRCRWCLAQAAIARLEAEHQRLLADNSALLGVLRKVGGDPCAPDLCDWCLNVSNDHAESCIVAKVLAQPHHGAALLEENERLESREAVAITALDVARARLGAMDGESLEDAAKRLRADSERLAGSLRGLLLSRDVAWDGKGLGHDWDEAVKTAIAALEEP